MSASHGGNLAVGSDLKLTCLVTASPVPTVIWSVTRRDNNQVIIHFAIVESDNTEK